MKGNPHKKTTFEDRFDRNFACWVKNERKAWKFWKRRNNKLFRKQQKEIIRKESEDLL